MRPVKIESEEDEFPRPPQIRQVDRLGATIAYLAARPDPLFGAEARRPAALNVSEVIGPGGS